MTHAISIGDPEGIGPELILKALAHFSAKDQQQWMLFADPWVLEQWAERLRLPMPQCQFHALGIKTVGPEMAWASLAAASQALNAKKMAGIVTAPISKERLRKIGFPYPGHTEFFQAEAKAKTVRMMFVGNAMRVVLETIHVPLRQVATELSSDHFRDTLTLSYRVLQSMFAIPKPKIAVCGLNPHAGENGLLGREEQEILAPVIGEFADADVQGPFASDAYFGLKRYENYDATICLYHDQGLIPFKLLHFNDGVNMTIGLPYLRTSPDHGPAFDIAGRGIADERSFLAACMLLMSTKFP